MFRAQRGALRPWILSMLQAEPKNGAEIINEVEKASMGWWRPSPGSVYPLLDSMVQDGLVTRRDDGKYVITAKGKDESAWLHGPWGPIRQRPANIDAMLSDIETHLLYFEDLVKANKPQMLTYQDRIEIIKQRIAALLETLST
jgi:DNA-binding PadR family transcriptional regulator